MSTPTAVAANSKPVASSRTIAMVLCGIIVACIGLIGMSGYVKYEIDRAATNLLVPTSQLTQTQTAFAKLRNDLGVSGFLGSAQGYASTHDANILSTMKSQLKQAGESFDNLPEKAQPEVRHDLQAIITTFDAAMQKAEKATSDGSGAFSMNDVAPLYATLPILDARINEALTSGNTSGKNSLQFWSMILTIICWCSLIVASALAAGIYFVMRDRNSAPMRALAQSVKNMARGDMRTSIWGMERQDAIGELARSVDMARFHFSQLPDMSLLSEQGPVRIRFEGNTRSLFEAMMRVISRDSETVHEQAAQLTQNVTSQQEMLNQLIQRVDAVFRNVESRATHGDMQVKNALQSVLNTATSLNNAQEHASDQLNRIIPFLQERAHGIGEIAQITGRQVSQALHALSSTERGLRATAESSEATITKIASSADAIGERMFGAVNLLQASGKVLAETTSSFQSRIDEVLSRMMEAKPQTPADEKAGSPMDFDIALRFGAVVEALETSQSKLQEILAEQAASAKAHIDLLITQSGSLLSQTATSSHTLSAASEHMREEQAKLNELLEKINLIVGNAATEQQTEDHPVVADIRTGFATIEERLAALHEGVAGLLQKADEREPMPAEMSEQMKDHWYQMASQIEASRSNLAQIIAQQTDKVEDLIRRSGGGDAGNSGNSDTFIKEAHMQLEQQTTILTELVNTLGLLDAHMQDIRGQLAGAKQKFG